MRRPLTSRLNRTRRPRRGLSKASNSMPARLSRRAARHTWRSSPCRRTPHQQRHIAQSGLYQRAIFTDEDVGVSRNPGLR
jgi:hypothetical protein